PSQGWPSFTTAAREVPMSTQRVVLLLAALNVALGLLVVASHVRPTEAQTGPVLRGRALEIVDEAGRVRASINVAPAGTAAGVTPAVDRSQRPPDDQTRRLCRRRR